jgi:MYXO-CTERM domain-containing protein
MGAPVYLDGSGQPISTIPCGTPATFNVPGYSRVWLEQKRNGFPTFDGPYNVPSPAYSAACDRDVGTYQNNVYELDSSGGKGALIGSVAAVVTLGTSFNNNPPAGGSGCVSCYTPTGSGGGNYAPGGGNSPGGWGGGKPAVGGRDTSTSSTSSTSSTTTTAAAAGSGIPWGLVLLVLVAIAILRR